ncbi:MAG: GNAT family N-acetyltransferase [Rhodobacteraceae bacterium]|jgi:ribosomal protein S18 acetylase RimI-like enzyme|nr:GNAT family N-acetyltransferase [Paracoccaceae bacterium]
MGARAFRADLGCGEALVLERPGLRLVTRGPHWAEGTSGGDRRQALRRLARFPGVLMVTPEEPLRGFGLVPIVTPMAVAFWDLTGDLRAGMAGKWRNRLARAERSDPRLGRGGAETLRHLVAAEAAQARARGYRGHPAAFTLALPPDALRLWEWVHAGQRAAAMAFVVEGAAATWHLSWAAPEARARGIPGLMLTRAAEALQAEGIRRLDLGTVNGEAAPGLLRFKLGTGARLHRLGATAWVLPG